MGKMRPEVLLLKKSHREGSCIFCPIEKLYEMDGGRPAEYIGPPEVYHIKIGQGSDPYDAIATIRVCLDHLCDLDNSWTETVEAER